MNSYSKYLMTLFQAIPVYGYGTIAQIEDIRSSYIQVVSTLTDKLIPRETAEELMQHALVVREIADKAAQAKTKRMSAVYFDRAANQLSLGIESLIDQLEGGLYDIHFSAS